MPKYDNKFKDGPNDKSQPGEHDKNPENFNSTEWWKRKLGFGTKKGEGALAKRRKKVVDSNIEKAGG